ncbi:nuclear transport factor 2 family protein [Streptomyces hirsutus]|uniref:nuclear transport factor 2 family protein n=1 Tax=Streptomyces hirsutus TaxID=35620 RepID=UPI0036688FC6
MRHGDGLVEPEPAGHAVVHVHLRDDGDAAADRVAHVVGPPHITVDGDEAVAVCHSLMIVHEEGRYVVRRATANHWLLRRTDSGSGWQVVTRTNRILDGRPESPALLTRGVRGEPAGA